jgi:hypothetical protein
MLAWAEWFEDTGSGCASSSCFCSGDAELEPARLSRSSSLFFSFLPGATVRHRNAMSACGRGLTIVALSNPILYPPAFSKVGDLGPVLVRVRTGTESTAGAVCGGILLLRCLDRIGGIAITSSAMHRYSIVHVVHVACEIERKEIVGRL